MATVILSGEHHVDKWFGLYNLVTIELWSKWPSVSSGKLSVGLFSFGRGDDLLGYINTLTN